MTSEATSLPFELDGTVVRKTETSVKEQLTVDLLYVLWSVEITNILGSKSSQKFWVLYFVLTQTHKTIAVEE